ncbi:MFS transporter [Acinetobacter rudis]|uniref:MFS transporter n=1 Tax=Acinetobacter rudis TaxID=632955 RepID=A0AAW8J8L1_9GAMM|nr:MFS transporter [Acinetobacter rudis]MDQ8935812.1 MFS transporter [Acinetobacter rudis]MDQ9017987.1 MFS transporter [Acinetobacter rudis]
MNRQNKTLSAVETESSKEDIPILKLLTFTLAGFITIMTETIPAGLLSLISKDLQVTEALAGQLVSVYALGSVIAAIPVVAATRSWSRRPLFLLAISGLLIFNTLTALSSSYIVVLVARFIAGMSAGIIWGILAGYARSMVSINLQGRALAIVGVGQPIALCMGVPLGTWLGSIFGWRGVFWIISLLALFLLIWIRLIIPNISGQISENRQPIKEIFLHPGIRSVLAIIFLWILAHNILYTFITPYLSLVGLGNRVDLVLLLFGVSSIIGIWITGVWVDKALRLLTLLSLVGFAIAAILIGLGGASNNAWLVLSGITLWGMAFGGAPTLLQTAIADTAGEGADVAQSMLVTVFNFAVAGGGLLGGILLQKIGPLSLTIAMCMLSIISVYVILQSKTHGFRNR